MKRTLGFIIAILSIAAAMCGCTGSSESTDGKAKYIFLFIGDGMGASQVAVAESYLSYKAGQLGGEQLTFTKFPELALCSTHSADRMITCSAASATAIACGQKTKNETLGVDPEGKPLKSIAYELHEQGYNVGIMTTVPVNHATPAGFYAHNDSRYGYYDISRTIPETGFEFFGGSGFYNYKGYEGNLDPVDAYIEEQGYPVCYGVQEFKEATDSAEHIVFIQESGRETDPEYYVSDGMEASDIRLAEMLGLCLDFIGDDKPFFIMCEGGNIDWSAHSNKTMAMVQDILEFDDAVAKALEFYQEHPDETLIVVTADHETGGVSIGQGKDWRPEFVDWKLIEDHWTASGEKNVLGYDENREMNDKALIGWTSCHHTGAPVPVYAIGKGAEKFNGRIDNTDIKGKILGE